jgi:hypothetical protein
MSTPTPSHRPLAFATGILLAGLLGVGCYTGSGMAALAARLEALEIRTGQVLDEVHAEVTRMRLEQSAGGLGANALMTKLRHFAPILVSGRTTQPDYDAAQKEMQAILRAFATVGKDAWQPIVDRLNELKADKNFDELKWLLEAAVRVDPTAGKEIVHQVLLGTRLPSARLRWTAADIMIRVDRPLAQRLLRQVLNTESSRGMNPERAAAYGAVIPDTAAFATSGFHNFVLHYLRSEDPEIEETLLNLIVRTEHDIPTIQECVEELGRRKCERAVSPIQKLYQQPPGHQDNPLFQIRCLEALHAIQGPAARPFFETALAEATHDLVKKRLTGLVQGK